MYVEFERPPLIIIYFNICIYIYLHITPPVYIYIYKYVCIVLNVHVYIIINATKKKYASLKFRYTREKYFFSPIYPKIKDILQKALRYNNLLFVLN